MENYIVINGKKAELTPEQLKALGIATEKKSPFSRVENKDPYYYISWDGQVLKTGDFNGIGDNNCFNTANYCTNKELLQQQAYREILNRLLWRYSMEHDGDKINWDNVKERMYYIYYNYDRVCFSAGCTTYSKSFERVYFYTKETAEKAIKEIVEPFMEEHPDFKW